MKKSSKRWIQGLALTALIVGGVPLVSQAATNESPIPPLGLQLGQSQGGMMTIMSEKLGISIDDLRSDRQSGMSIAAIAKEKGLTTDQLMDTMITQHSQQLDQLVSDGTITKQERDQYLSTMQERMSQMLERTTTGRPEWAGQGQMGNGKGFGRAMNGTHPNTPQRGYGQGFNGTVNN